MFKSSMLLFLYAETPLHVGSGTSVEVIDLPIQRERHTQFPMIQASGVKGAIRALAKELKDDKNKTKIDIVFGPEEGEKHAGAISFSDARLLLLPVRALKGVFAWTTCPTVLSRLKRDLSLLSEEQRPDWKPPSVSEGQALLPKGSLLLVGENKIILEEFSFNATLDGDDNGNITKIARWFSENAFPEEQNDDEYNFWREKVKTNLVILSDDDFRDFALFGTDVVARTQIDTVKRIVKSGSLWYEESLPPESLLYSVVLATDPRDKSNTLEDANEVINFVRQDVFSKADRFQLGGDETVGRGIVKIRLLGGESGGNKTNN